MSCTLDVSLHSVAKPMFILSRCSGFGMLTQMLLLIIDRHAACLLRPGSSAKTPNGFFQLRSAGIGSFEVVRERFSAVVLFLEDSVGYVRENPLSMNTISSG